MKLNDSDITDYGLRYLSLIGKRRNPVSASQLADAEGISLLLVKEITNKLLRKGLIQFERGGFKLINNLKLEEAVDILKKSLYPIAPASRTPESLIEDNMVWRSGTF